MRRIKLNDLKKSLSECHMASDDRNLPFYHDVKDPSYFLNRTLEAIHEVADGIDVYENTKLAIQLLNVYRVILRTEETTVPIMDAVEARHETLVTS